MEQRDINNVIFSAGVGKVYASVLEQYQTAMEYREQDFDIDNSYHLGVMVSNTTRRRMFREALDVLGCIFKKQPFEVRPLIKLINLHKRQLFKLKYKSRRINIQYLNRLKEFCKHMWVVQ